MTRNSVLAAVGAASLLLGACGSTESGTLTLTLEHLDCRDGDALQGAQQIEVTVSGPGMTAISGSGNASAKSLALPEIPAGKDREVIVRATNGADVNPTVLAIGRSAKFTVKADQDQTVVVPMVALNRVRPTETANGECTSSALRAGHAAAALSDGRVLLVGGFLPGTDPAGPLVTYLDTVELYDPATGGFADLGTLPAICGASGDESCARAFAAAVVQPTTNGKERVLIVGGEYRDEAGHPLARGEILVFEPSTQGWSRIDLIAPRRFATATLVGAGEVFIVGGFGNPDPVDAAPPVVGTTETVAPRATASVAARPTIERALHAAVARGSELLVAGGVDGAGLFPAEVLSAIPTANTPQTVSTLTEGLIGPSLAVFGNRLVVIGGIRPHGDASDPLDALGSDYLGPAGTPGVVAGYVIVLGGGTRSSRAVGNEEYPLEIDRSFACTAKIDDNRLLVAGGITPSGSVVLNDSSVEVLAWIDESACTPKEGCSSNTECESPSTCVDSKCLLACTDDAGCLVPGQTVAKGACVDGYCKSLLTNPDHRCAATGTTGCFAGTELCSDAGHFGRSSIGASGWGGSRLLQPRAWNACTTLSADQILITGGLDPARAALGDAELYEITHAGR